VDENKKIIVAALVVMLGSNTTGILNAINPNFRAGAFTSLDAEHLKEEILDLTRSYRTICMNRMASLESNNNLLNFKIDDCLKRTKP
jgi:hypothetical protein